jgi:hypothetical protein
VNNLSKNGFLTDKTRLLILNYTNAVDIVGIYRNRHYVMSAHRNTESPESADWVDRVAIAEQAEWLETLAPWVASLRFGVIQLVFHEGRVVQMERTEKVRLAGSKGAKGVL